MTGMHADEIAIADETVRRLVAAQLPDWSGLPVRRLPPIGTDNQLFRLGDELLVRMPRVPGPAETVAFEHAWLPRLAEHLSVSIPAPVALGEPGEGYPFAWTVVPWIEGENPTEATFDPEEWAVSVAAFVRSCRSVPGMDGPVKTEGRGAPLEALDGWVREWTAKADESEVSRDAVLEVWDDALSAPAYDGEPPSSTAPRSASTRRRTAGRAASRSRPRSAGGPTTARPRRTSREARWARSGG